MKQTKTPNWELALTTSLWLYFIDSVGVWTFENGNCHCSFVQNHCHLSCWGYFRKQQQQKKKQWRKPHRKTKWKILTLAFSLFFVPHIINQTEAYTCLLHAQPHSTQHEIHVMNTFFVVSHVISFHSQLIFLASVHSIFFLAVSKYPTHLTSRQFDWVSSFWPRMQIGFATKFWIVAVIF